MKTLIWIGFCQSLFAAILMFTKKESSLPDKILSGWLILLSFDFLSCGINYEIFDRPLLISSFLLLNPFFIQDKNFLFRMSFAVANFVSWSVYNPLSLILVHKHRMHLHNELSNIEKNENLGWVLAVAIFYFVYCILAFIIAVVAFFFTDINPLTPHIYNYFTLLIFIYVISFYGLRQQKVAKHLLVDEPVIPYKNSNLSVETKAKIKQKIITYFEKEKAYLNPELSMDVLSESLKIQKYQIT